MDCESAEGSSVACLINTSICAMNAYWRNGLGWMPRNMPGNPRIRDTPPLRQMPELRKRSIMNQTGHRSARMVRGYIRDGSLFREHSARKLGLWRNRLEPVKRRLRTGATPKLRSG